MFKIDEIIGIKMEDGSYQPLEFLDDVIWLSPAAYDDVVRKLGRIYLMLKEDQVGPLNIDINEKVAELPDFWEVLKPTLEKIAVQFSNLDFQDITSFGQFLGVVNGYGSFALNLQDFTVQKLDFYDGTKSGVKITADNGASIYSFDDRDRDDFGRMRMRK